MYCKDCKFWKPRKEQDELDECSNEKVEDLYFSSNYGGGPPMCARPNFGCVLFEARRENGHLHSDVPSR